MGHREVIDEDEEELLSASRHWIVLVPPFAAVGLVLGGCVAAFLLWSSAPALFGAFLLLVVVSCAVVVVARVLRWRAARVVITSERVTFQEGLFQRSGREIPISRVQDVAYRQRLFGRMLGYGDLTVESAGASKAAPFAHLRRPRDAQRALNRAIERRANHGRRPVDVTEQLERLDALRQRGVVTDAEFAQKKAELLARW